MDNFKRGNRVRAFHPGRFGVINYATVTKVGSKYLYLDFGEILGGIRRVHPIHVVEIVADNSEGVEGGENLGTA